MSDPTMKGWDLMYNIVEKDVKKKEDILVAFIHLVLINCDYRCLGLGDSKEITGNEKPSEVLPSQWNDDSSSYSLRYLKDGKLYILKALVADDDIVVNLLNVQDVRVNTLTFNVARTVKSMKGDSLKNLIVDHNEVAHKIRCELANFIKEATTQTCQQEARRGRQEPQIGVAHPHPSRGVDPILPISRIGPYDYGRADLDPFAAGGGMIFDPLNSRQPSVNPGLGIPGQLPRGARPPGARFDPMGPPDLDRRPRPRLPPDSDNIPPGYEDMFM